MMIPSVLLFKLLRSPKNTSVSRYETKENIRHVACEERSLSDVDTNNGFSKHVNCNMDISNISTNVHNQQS